MPYIIVRPDAEPLADLDGNVIYITSMAEARSWCMPGETIADWEEWAARDASPTFDS